MHMKEMAGGGEQGATCSEQVPESGCLLQELSVVMLNIYRVQMGGKQEMQLLMLL